ncbi:helix-turn-helix domain-containing protein [Gordonia sp. NPDC062954]|uniref:helix-turn-helix domain-containing protein n=1 Tax=Gordonia sp. NPDC062954 TaxID=3364003 RepID=UPI0037C97710
MRHHSIPEAARMLGVAESTLYRWVKLGTAEASTTPGGRLCLSDAELARLRDYCSSR